MPFTKTLTVTTDEQNIVAQSETRKVTVKENGASTSAFLIKRPGTANTAITRAAGESQIFEAQENSVFLPGAILGRIYLSGGGPVTFLQDEQ